MADTPDNKQAPAEEQQICVTCGFCCDGTLFLLAHLDPGERGSGLPVKIEESSLTENGRDYFHLPCKYFSGKCTIYNRKKANVCSSYRCQLLGEYAAGRISSDGAREVVREAMVIRDGILGDYRNPSANGGDMCFRQLLIDLSKNASKSSNEYSDNDGRDFLLARCNIFEALLTRHFRSREDFDKLIMK